MPVGNAKTFLLICFSAFVAGNVSCQSRVHAQPGANISSLNFLGAYEITYSLRFKNTTVGGLSGIDYDADHQRYYIISDDKGAIEPARYYTASIILTQKGIDSVYFTGVKNMLQPNGKPYPNNKQDPYHTPDPEAIRYNPLNKQLVWSSEGERIINSKDTVLVNAAVTTISMQGKYLNSFSLPHNLRVQAIEKGPRQNGVLEGITFADNYTTLFVNAEEPLYEDGARADNTPHKAYIRIFQFDLARKRNTKQFGYQLEPVAYPPFPAGAFKINGVPDILSIAKNKLLVVERSFSTGRLACTVKLFIADLSAATDIKNTPSLKNATGFVPAAKKLLLNMDDLGIYTGNIEGVSFGPALPNGHKTLLFVADNNFNPLERSQLLLFEVIE
ncbi:MAG: esterase-like activity of phytase family protein [Ferruginibacter sp.]|nr:esterase-like activity of phytase family protein [Ferruginibacter sp.]